MITITPKANTNTNIDISTPEIVEVEYSPHWLNKSEPSKSTSKAVKTGKDLAVAIQELKTAPKHIE